jgi:asparagine synthase (glutamine-hydrolysing)
MPGLVGLAGAWVDSHAAPDVLLRMRQLMLHRDYYGVDEPFLEAGIGGARVGPGVVGAPSRDPGDPGVVVWLDGEFYNQPELNPDWHRVHGSSDDAGLLRTLYAADPGFGFLARIDGFFAAAIYDRTLKRVHLISDRYGLRHLYWTEHRGGVAWASEVKAFLALPGFEPTISQRAVDEFIAAGHLLENRTWFERVALLDSGSVYTYDLTRRTGSMRRYWWWDEIRPVDVSIPEVVAADRIGELFLQAVDKRCRQGERIGVGLSGGLDSRAILAAMPERARPIHALTFGRPESSDVRIAARVAALKGAIHHVEDLNRSNWLAARFAGVWLTDGQLDLMHMHGLSSHERTRAEIPIAFNGFAGDLLLGGSMLDHRSVLDKVDRLAIARRMKCPLSLLTSLDRYAGLGKGDYFVLQNRVRRFTAEGQRAALAFKAVRKPFYDNDLIEYAYSLPDRLRFRSRVYNRMLLRTFPEYFKSIPWQSTGVPISYPRALRSFMYRTYRAGHRVSGWLDRFGLNYQDSREYTDYSAWIRRDPARSIFEALLLASTALVRRHVQAADIRRAWEEHMSGLDRAARLCRYLTLEIWLQQVLEGRYRSGWGERVESGYGLGRGGS